MQSKSPSFSRGAHTYGLNKCMSEIFYIKQQKNIFVKVIGSFREVTSSSVLLVNLSYIGLYSPKDRGPEMAEITWQIIIFNVADDIIYLSYIAVWVLEMIKDWESWQSPMGLPSIHKDPVSVTLSHALLYGILLSYYSKTIHLSTLFHLFIVWVYIYYWLFG